MLLAVKVLKLRRKRVSLAVLATLMMAMIYILRSLSTTSETMAKCEMSPEMRIKLSDLLTQITESLQSLGFTYFLCYYSLWGALKVRAPLKWHQNLDICLLNEEVALIEEAFVIRTFKRHGLSISYHSTDGLYVVSSGDDSEPNANLYLFEEDTANSHYRRVGWKNRLVPPNNCQMIHCFPPRLVSKPLPTHQFMSHTMPVPHEEIEIQKYLFPENWWKDLEPKHCREK